MSEGKSTAWIPGRVVRALTSIIDQDSSRRVLRYLHITEQHIEAADGYIAAWVPATTDGAVDVMLLPKVFGEIMKGAVFVVHPGNETEPPSIVLPFLGTLSVQPSLDDPAKFVDIDHVAKQALERPDEDVLHVSFTVGMLGKLVAFASKMGGEFISLDIPIKRKADGKVECENERGYPFVVSSEPPGYGVIMPARRLVGEGAKVKREYKKGESE